MSHDFGGWDCKQCLGEFSQPEIVDATFAQLRQIQQDQQAHLEWHAEQNAQVTA